MFLKSKLNSDWSLFYQFFYSKVFRILYRLFCLLPLKDHKILFASFSRKELSGNFKFVYEELKRRDLDFSCHFILKSSIKERSSYLEIISLAYHIATSKFVLLDDFFPMIYYLRIRKDAELIQLWHAVGAFKTFGYSRVGLPGGPSINSVNHKNYTKAIVSSKNIIKHYAEGFGIDPKKVIATGIPRTDVFFDRKYKENIVAELYQKYPYLKYKKVILFAPTFRGGGQQTAYYEMDKLDLDKIYNVLNGEYVFIFKLHPFVKDALNIPKRYKNFYHDFSSYREINDLLFITDILVTDYSSVCFEFALLNKPMIFFSYDVEDYIKERDFYYNYYSFIPGPLVKSTDELINIIQTGDFMMDKISSFLNYFYDHFDGKSSARVVDQLILGKRNKHT